MPDVQTWELECLLWVLLWPVCFSISRFPGYPNTGPVAGRKPFDLLTICPDRYVHGEKTHVACLNVNAPMLLVDGVQCSPTSKGVWISNGTEILGSSNCGLIDRNAMDTCRIGAMKNASEYPKCSCDYNTIKARNVYKVEFYPDRLYDDGRAFRCHIECMTSVGPHDVSMWKEGHCLNITVDCNRTSYGEQCNETCGRCADKKRCDQDTGWCDECEPGFEFPFCQTCQLNLTGADCDQCKEEGFQPFSCTECKPRLALPDCQDCTKPGFEPPECLQCHLGLLFPECVDCIRPGFVPPDCKECVPGFSLPDCRFCNNPKLVPPNCTEPFQTNTVLTESTPPTPEARSGLTRAQTIALAGGGVMGSAVVVGAVAAYLRDLNMMFGLMNAKGRMMKDALETIPGQIAVAQVRGDGDSDSSSDEEGKKGKGDKGSKGGKGGGKGDNKNPTNVAGVKAGGASPKSVAGVKAGTSGKSLASAVGGAGLVAAASTGLQKGAGGKSLTSVAGGTSLNAGTKSLASGKSGTVGKSVTTAKSSASGKSLASVKSGAGGKSVTTAKSGPSVKSGTAGKSQTSVKSGAGGKNVPSGKSQTSVKSGAGGKSVPSGKSQTGVKSGAGGKNVTTAKSGTSVKSGTAGKSQTSVKSVTIGGKSVSVTSVPDGSYVDEGGTNVTGADNVISSVAGFDSIV